MELQTIIGDIVEDSSREACIEKMPFLLAKEEMLNRLLEQQKIVKKQIEMATVIIGAYDCEEYNIEEKLSKKTVVKAQAFEQAFAEIEKEFEKLDNSKKGLFSQLEQDIKEEQQKALLSNTQKRMKILQQINPEKAQSITEIETTKKLVLKAKKSLLKDFEDKLNEESKNKNNCKPS